MQSDPLHQLLQSALTASDYELVGYELFRQGKHSLLRVYIDKADGITLDDCVEASRQISAVLDVEDPIKSAYQLEVSSPGIDRPLFTLEHYQRFVGQGVKLRLRQPVAAQRNFIGELIAVEGEKVRIKLDDGRVCELEFGNIEKAKLVPEL